MTSADGSGVITIYDEGLARRLKALACTAPLHDLDARKVRLDWCDGAEYQMAEIALQAIDQVTVAMDFDRGADHQEVVNRVLPFVAAQVTWLVIRFSSAINIRIQVARGGISTSRSASTASEKQSSLESGDR